MENCYLCIADNFYTLALIKRNVIMILLRAKSVCLIDFGNFLALMVKMLIALGSEYCDSWSKLIYCGKFILPRRCILMLIFMTTCDSLLAMHGLVICKHGCELILMISWCERLLIIPFSCPGKCTMRNAGWRGLYQNPHNPIACEAAMLRTCEARKPFVFMISSSLICDCAWVWVWATYPQQ